MPKDKSSASDDASTSSPSDAPATSAAQLSMLQWCSVTGKHPHRTMAFMRSQPANEQHGTKTAEQWDAAYSAFMQTPVA